MCFSSQHKSITITIQIKMFQKRSRLVPDYTIAVKEHRDAHVDKYEFTSECEILLPVNHQIFGIEVTSCLELIVKIVDKFGLVVRNLTEAGSKRLTFHRGPAESCIFPACGELRLQIFKVSAAQEGKVLVNVRYMNMLDEEVEDLKTKTHYFEYAVNPDTGLVRFCSVKGNLAIQVCSLIK